MLDCNYFFGKIHSILLKITAFKDALIKLDKKNIVIITLVGVIGILVGIIVGQSISKNSKTTSPTPVIMDQDGKLAKSYKEQVLVKTIRENAKDIQTCYLDYLAMKPKIIEGDFAFNIKVEEDGEITSMKMTNNDFKQDSFADCVTRKIKSYRLSPPPLGINRNIDHNISFKTQETADREALERSKSFELPKVLPVSK